MATVGVGVQANELNITKPEVCGNGSLAASVEAVKSTDGNPWREARAELAASSSGDPALCAAWRLADRSSAAKNAEDAKGKGSVQLHRLVMVFHGGDCVLCEEV